MYTYVSSRHFLSLIIGHIIHVRKTPKDLWI